MKIAGGIMLALGLLFGDVIFIAIGLIVLMFGFSQDK